MVSTWVAQNGSFIEILNDTQIPAAGSLRALIDVFVRWLGPQRDRSIVLCGKNVKGFDELFLGRIESWPRHLFHHRVLDPGSIYAYPEDEVPPDLKTCCLRAGIPCDAVPHRALPDAYLTGMCVLKALQD